RNIPKGSSFEIRTPAGISGARGTGWGSKTDGETAIFSSYENAIYVKGINRDGSVMEGELTVSEGFRAVVDKFERPERLEQISRADIDRWNGFRQEVIGRSPEIAKEAATSTPEKATEKRIETPTESAAEERAEKTAGAIEERAGRTIEKTQSIIEQAESTIDRSYSRLDRIAKEETQIERLEAKKQDIQETRDISQIAAKEEAREPIESKTTSVSDASGISGDTSGGTINKGE
ncbi:MAG: hypothetical protein NC933_04610, partial [Candidatus Omnitrophica bacterium]|nr:hypothetical protein [Candidatus Omnitrophota bacterium]